MNRRKFIKGVGALSVVPLAVDSDDVPAKEVGFGSWDSSDNTVAEYAMPLPDGGTFYKWGPDPLYLRETDGGIEFLPLDDHILSVHINAIGKWWGYDDRLNDWVKLN